jgi:hypothetical protein
MYAIRATIIALAILVILVRISSRIRGGTAIDREAEG